MAQAPSMVDCPYCFAGLPANARYCGGCGRAIRMSALLPVITQPPQLEEARAAFLRQYPGFASTAILDDLRLTDYARLDQQTHVYLDYTGGGLYAESQLREHMALLTSHVFGNPHSTNPASQAMTDVVEQTRAAILTYFNADPNEYEAGTSSEERDHLLALSVSNTMV